MLCCVSRKASPLSKNKKTDNSHENHKKSVLQNDSATSSGFSSSSFDSSDNFNSSLSSNLTVSSLSTSQNTSGFSSSPSIPQLTNSSSDTFSIPSAFSSDYDDASNFLADNSNVIHTIGPNSPNPEFPETPKLLQTFSTPAKHDNNHETPENIESDIKLDISTKDEPSELLPCAICARTFKPQSLEKHTRICERSAIKKRKPFDSAKQRIQGTELAEFLPKETIKRKVYQSEDKTTNNKGSWKQTHDEFLQAIRAARGETIEVTRPHQLVPASNVTVGVPTRPNEKGMCPTCNRQFSIKSYERHVEWCKDRATKVPMSAATNIAKERLEARMKYRAPALKNRRTTVREKYSPSSTSNLGISMSTKINNGNAANQRAKETSSTPNCHEKIVNENVTGNSQSQKSTANTRRLGQGREGMSSGPLKSRLSDRSNRPSGENDSGTTSNFPTPRENSSRVSNNPIPRYPRNSPTKTHLSTNPNASARQFRKMDNSIDVQDDNEENIDEKIHEQRQKSKGINETSMKNRRCRQNIVHARSHGNPRINDVTINDDVMGMTVQPCNRRKMHGFDEEFVTWKKISEESLKSNEFLKFHSVKATKCSPESESLRVSKCADVIDDESNLDVERNEEFQNYSWTRGTEKFDQTYLIKESLDGRTDPSEFFGKRHRRPVIDSPRNEIHYDRKSVENNFSEDLNGTETSPKLRYEIKKESERKLEKNMIESPSFQTHPKLEPLNLCNLGNGDELELSFGKSYRSGRSTVSIKKTPQSNSKQNTSKSNRVLTDGLSDSKSKNYEGRDAKNDEHSTTESGLMNSNPVHAEAENMFILNTLRSLNNDQSSKKSVGEEPLDQISMKNNIDQDFEIVETPRSSKSTKSGNNSGNELLMKKVIKMNEPINENEFIAEESLNFESPDGGNSERPRSKDIIKEIDKQAQSFNFSESPNNNESPKNDCEEITRKIKRTDSKESFSHDSLNCTSRNDKNGEQLREKTLSGKNRSKIDNDDPALETSRSQKSTRSPKINCENLLTKKMAKMQSIAKNLNLSVHEDRKRENVKNKVSHHDTELKIHDKSIPRSSELLDQSTKNTTIKETDNIPNKVKGQNKKSMEFSEKEIDKKNEPKIEPKINYARCKTYVIDKKDNCNNDKKHHAPQELPDDKPLKKKRRTENPEIDKVSNVEIDHSIEKKLIPHEMEGHKIESSANEDLESKSEKCFKNLENTNDRKIDTIEKIREFSEKYVNQTFNYDSDETLTSENYLKGLGPESSIKMEEKLSTVSDASYLDIYQKSFSDSFVPREQISVDTFLRTQVKPEVENVQNCPVSNNIRTSTVSDITQLVQESQNQNAVGETSSIMRERPEVEETCDVPKEDDDTILNRDTFLNKQKTVEIQDPAEPSQQPRRKESIADTLPEIREKQQSENCLEAVRKLEDENTLESSYKKNPEASGARTSGDRRQKLRSTNCILPKVLENPEEQNLSVVRKKLREKIDLLRGDSNNLITPVETSDEVLNNKNSLSNMGSLETRSIGEIEEETIQEIVFGKLGDTYDSRIGICGFLPEIPIDRIITKNDSSKNGKKFLPVDGASFAWQRGVKNSTVRLINLDLPKFNRETKIPCKRLTNVGNLPSVAPFGEERRRISDRDSRAVWSKYVRRHPDFNLVLTGRTGSCADYDPFLIAERQMNELLSDTCSEKSLTDSSSNRRRSSSSPTLPNYPLSHSSAFVKYSDSSVGKIPKLPEKRVSLIAPPTEFDDFSSDSTETNSISREIKHCPSTYSRSPNDETRRKSGGRDHVLGRRVIIDKSKALGIKETYDDTTSIRSLIENSSGNGKVRKLFEKTAPKVTRSNSVRTNSGPKTNEKKINNSGNLSSSDKINNIQNNRNNNYPSLSGSNVSLNSIVSSDIEVKRSNSAFDELASSCDDDTSGIYPSLRYLLKNDSLSVTSPVQSNRPRNGQISDEEFSSPDSYKRHHEHNKLSADSAYSSLNRKYSNHGRSTNDMAGRHDEDSPLHRRDVETVGSIARSKLSKFCHECGSKFPETAKFCCECGIKRLAL